jgi:hypothetical protein
MKCNKASQTVLGVLLFSFLFFASESELKAQGILSRKISISFKQKSIEEVVRYLQNFHGVPFSYSRNVINLKQKVSGNYDNIKLKAVLDDIFSQSDVIYTFKAEMIILLPKPQNLDKLLITGTIKTIDDGVPVEFAGVQLKSSGKGTITDSKGKFSMIIRKEELSDSLMVSSLGFYKMSFLASAFKKEAEHVVYLRRRIIDLEELKVKASDYKTVKVGNKGILSFGSIYIDTQGQQTALFIENKKKKKGTVSSASFYLSKKGNTNSPFRVRIYEREKLSAKPGEDLLKEVIIAKPNIDGGWFKVDLSQFHIEAPEDGFFVAIEGIYPYDYMQEDAGFEDVSDDEMIPNSVSYGQRLGYSKKNGKNTWHYSLAHTWFQLKEQNYNVMISAEIQIKK